MIIIFDGPDNCGKTSIAKALVEKCFTSHAYFKIKQDKIHLNKYNPDTLKTAHELQLDFFAQLAAQSKMNIVMDRFHPSEYVYGSLFRKIDEEVFWHYDKMLGEAGVKIVIPIKSDEFLEDDLWTRDQLIAIKQKFMEFSEKTACQVLVINTEDEELEEQLAKITKFLYEKF